MKHSIYSDVHVIKIKTNPNIQISKFHVKACTRQGLEAIRTHTCNNANKHDKKIIIHTNGIEEKDSRVCKECQAS
jgi:hypothetical protein